MTLQRIPASAPAARIVDALQHDGAVIVADVRGEQQPPQAGIVTHVIKVRVADADAACEQARAHGAVVLQEPTEYEYGERECTVEDLAGHHWQFTQTMRDVAPEEWGGESFGQWP